MVWLDRLTSILKTYQSQNWNSILDGCNRKWSRYHGFEFMFGLGGKILSVRATVLQLDPSEHCLCLTAHWVLWKYWPMSWNSGISVWKGGGTNWQNWTTYLLFFNYLTCASSYWKEQWLTNQEKGVGLGVCQPMTIPTLKIKTRAHFDDVSWKHY